MIGVLDVMGAGKRYGAVWALRATNLQIAQGMTTALIGPSGCGKSTLIRLMMGLIEPDVGRIEFEGEPLCPDRILQQRRRMGYVIQDGGLFPHLTARANIALMARYLRRPADEIAARVETLAELTRFPEDGLDRYPVQLSGGQRQRVSLMRALMLDPHVLLLDEPLGALDPMIRADLQTDLKDIFTKLNKTVVLVTHDMGEAGFFGDTIVLMRDGEIVQQGSFESLVRKPADEFVERFINAQRSPLDAVEAAGDP